MDASVSLAFSYEVLRKLPYSFSPALMSHFLPSDANSQLPNSSCLRTVKDS